MLLIRNCGTKTLLLSNYQYHYFPRFYNNVQMFCCQSNLMSKNSLQIQRLSVHEIPIPKERLFHPQNPTPEKRLQRRHKIKVFPTNTMSHPLQLQVYRWSMGRGCNLSVGIRGNNEKFNCTMLLNPSLMISTLKIRDPLQEIFKLLK